jgi:hypothetical protein
MSDPDGSPQALASAALARVAATFVRRAILFRFIELPLAASARASLEGPNGRTILVADSPKVWLVPRAGGGHKKIARSVRAFVTRRFDPAIARVDTCGAYCRAREAGGP